MALGQLHEAVGDYDLAETEYIRTKKQRQESCGQWGVGCANDILTRCFLYFRIGAFAESEEILRSALPGVQMAHGTMSLDVACILTLLVVATLRLRKAGLFDAGHVASIALRAYRIRCAVFGRGSSLFLQHTIFTALLMEQIEAFRFAEPLFRMALAFERPDSDGSKESKLKTELFSHYEAANKAGFSSDEWRQPIPWPWFCEKTVPGPDPLLEAILSEPPSSEEPIVEISFVGLLQNTVPALFELLASDEGNENGMYAASVGIESEAFTPSLYDSTVRPSFP
jgi:hypothetical protein